MSSVTVFTTYTIGNWFAALVITAIKLTNACPVFCVHSVAGFTEAVRLTTTVNGTEVLTRQIACLADFFSCKQMHAHKHVKLDNNNIIVIIIIIIIITILLFGIYLE